METDRLAAEAAALQRAGRATEAVTRFEAALASSTLAITARAALTSDLGVALNQGGRQSEAVAAYRSSLALVLTGRTYNNLGVVLQARGDVLGAEAAYRAALALEASTLPRAVPLNMLRACLDGAHWRSWWLFEWYAQRQSEPPSPFERLEARAFLADQPAHIRAAAALEADEVLAAASPPWSCACPKRRRRRRLARLGRGRPLRVALLGDLDLDPSASLLRVALPWLHERRDVEVALLLSLTLQVLTTARPSPRSACKCSSQRRPPLPHR